MNSGNLSCAASVEISSVIIYSRADGRTRTSLLPHCASAHQDASLSRSFCLPINATRAIRLRLLLSPREKRRRHLHGSINARESLTFLRRREIQNLHLFENSKRLSQQFDERLAKDRAGHCVEVELLAGLRKIEYGQENHLADEHQGETSLDFFAPSVLIAVCTYSIGSTNVPHGAQAQHEHDRRWNERCDQ